MCVCVCLVKTRPSCSILLVLTFSTCVFLLGWADRSQFAKLLGRATWGKVLAVAHGPVERYWRERFGQSVCAGGQCFWCFLLWIIENLGEWKMQRPSEKAVWLCAVRLDPGYGLTTHTRGHMHRVCWTVKSQVVIVPFLLGFHFFFFFFAVQLGCNQLHIFLLDLFIQQ